VLGPGSSEEEEEEESSSSGEVGATLEATRARTSGAPEEGAGDPREEEEEEEEEDERERSPGVVARDPGAGAPREDAALARVPARRCASVYVPGPHHPPGKDTAPSVSA
jgi:hypothetical protein